LSVIRLDSPVARGDSGSFSKRGNLVDWDHVEADLVQAVNLLNGVETFVRSAEEIHNSAYSLFIHAVEVLD